MQFHKTFHPQLKEIWIDKYMHAIRSFSLTCLGLFIYTLVYIESMFYTSCVMLHTMFRLAMQMEIEKREEYRIVQVFSVTYTSRNRSGSISRNIRICIRTSTCIAVCVCDCHAMIGHISRSLGNPEAREMRSSPSRGAARP